MTNRYADLVKSVVGGSFYESKGVVIPYRYGATEVRLETDSVSTEFGLYINEVFSGSVVSDVEGNVVFNRVLPRGEIELTLINHVTGRRLLSWLTVREYALWFAAYATVLETIDDNIQTVRDDMAITTATIDGVEDNFGQYVGYYNDLGLDLDSYRKTLHELRLAYRNYGGQHQGFETAVSTITQVPPFGYSRRMWGPNWRLDAAYVENHRFAERAHSVVNSTGNITGVDVLSVEPDCAAGAPAGTLTYSNVTNQFTWAPGGVPGLATLAANGELFLPGPQSTMPAHILGDIASPFIVVAGVNDYLYLTIDDLLGGGYIPVQLVTGLPAPTAANVAADINAALAADPRFGAPYAVFSASYFFGGSNYLAMASPVAGGSSIRLDNGVQNAAPAVLGIVSGSLMAPETLMTGVTYVDAVGAIDINGGNATLEYRYNGTLGTRELRWNSPGLGVGAWVTLTDPGEYALVDAGACVLTVYAFPDDMDVLAAPWPSTTSVTFSLTYQRSDSSPLETQGLTVLVDTSLLPAAVLVDNIDVIDDSVAHYAHPDSWFVDLTPGPVVTQITGGSVISDRLLPYDPAPSYAWWVASAADTISVYSRCERFPTPWPHIRGSSSLQRSSGMIYDYEGFDMIVSCWLTNANNPGASAVVKVSFDGGITFYSSAPVILPLDPLSVGRPTFVSGEFRIEDGINFHPNFDRDIIVAVDVTSAILGHIIIFEACTVDVKYISSRYLTKCTVPRSRHRQYFGELQYVWSPDELSLRQKQYLGLPHKVSDKTTVYAGVTISVVSADTSAGTGTLEYSYNALGDIRSLRWSAQGTAWGPGLGWATIISTGAYTLYASDGSYLAVNVIREVLPILSGTPPAATTSKTIVISDTSVYQGLTRTISPAHIALDIFDATEYDTTTGVAKNLYGAITEADFSASTLTNLAIQPADPFMYSYVYPETLPVTGETLTVNPATFRAPLSLDSDQDLHNVALYGDGLPIPQTDTTGVPNWWFNNSLEIEMTPATYSPSVVYTLDYNLLYQITTTTMDLTGYELDYAWWADYLLWDRKDSERGEYLETVPLYFSGDTGQAFLDRPSTMDKKVAKLYWQDSLEQREVAQRYWRFINDTTVELDSSQIVAGSQYFLTHEEKRTYEVSSLGVGLRAVPNVLDLIPGVTIDYISSDSMGLEGYLEYEFQVGPIYLFTWASAYGGRGPQLAVALTGEYNLFDGAGNYIRVSIDLASVPVVVGVYKQTVLLKSGIKFEHRKGVNVPGCIAAPWREIERNESVSSVDNSGAHYHIHQLRLTVGGIRDLQDFRIRSLVLKGLHIHGATPSVPGLTNLWG